MSEVKFTDDELGKVKEIQDKYFNIQNEFGQLSMSRIRLEKQMINLDKEEEQIYNKFSEIEGEEKTFLDNNQEKYGRGVLNPDTGIFTPEKS